MTQDVLWVIQQAAQEMGLPKPFEAASSQETTTRQLVALLNACGNEMVNGYAWEQLTKEYVIETIEGHDQYLLPSDWSYFIDQTQWDRTNHWPLLGPKTAQEWQWLKSGIISSGPRLRYRVVGNIFAIYPTPAPVTDGGVFVPSTVAMEYVSDAWLMDVDISNTYYDSVQSDTNVPIIDPWILVKFLKLKYWEAKGLDTTAYTKDFLGMWEARIGKNRGAPILSMSPRVTNMLVGVNNIPDGSWNV
jgi:hypothetical protein